VRGKPVSLKEPMVLFGDGTGLPLLAGRDGYIGGAVGVRLLVPLPEGAGAPLLAGAVGKWSSTLRYVVRLVY